MEAQIQAYPLEIYYLCAFIGVVLVFYRPQWAFLFIVFCLAVRNYNMAVHTRTPFLGEFLNLNDLLLWIGVAAMIRTVWHSQSFWVPKILLLIISILIVGDFQAVYQYGFDNIVLKSLWASWIFALLFAVSTNMVRDIKDARLFYWTLFLGSLGAALQHVFFMQERLMGMPELTNVISLTGIRTIAFLGSGGLFLIISAFLIDMRKILQTSFLFIFWAIGILIIGISTILSFTRSVWLGGAMAGVALFILLYREHRKILSRLIYAMALLVSMFLVFFLTNRYLLSDVNLTREIDQRANFIRYEDSFEEAYQTRETGMETELNLWLDGSIIWGVGGCYPPSLAEAGMAETGALGHVAYSTYLAHFGLIGLLTYGFLLPFFTIRIGRRYYLQHKYDIGGLIAVTAMALAFYDVFTLLTSNQYLGPYGHVPALIYGSLWGLSRSLKVSSPRHVLSKLVINKSQQQWLPGRVQ
jgi:hypothetical protein